MKVIYTRKKEFHLFYQPHTCMIITNVYQMVDDDLLLVEITLTNHDAITPLNIFVN